MPDGKFPPQWLTLPSLLPGEDFAELEALVNALLEGIKPTDGIEQLLTSHLPGILWDMRRLRSAGSEQIRLNLAEAIVQVLTPVAGASNASNIARQWQIGTSDAIEGVPKILSDRRMTMATVQAAALGRSLESLSQMQRLISDLERRFDAILSTIERRRARKASAA